MADREVKVKVSALDAASATLKKVGLEADNLGKEGQKLSVNWRTAGVAMTAAGGAISGSIVAAAMNASKAGSALYDMSARTGMSVEKLSQLKFAAEQTGTNLEGVELGSKRLTVSMLASSDANSKAAQAFKRLGVDARDANGDLKSTEQVFMETGMALRDVESSSERTGIAIQLFGRTGNMLVPMFTDTSKSLEGLTAEADRLGLTMSKSAAEAADEFGDRLDALKASSGMLWMQIGTQVLPGLTEFVKGIQPIVSGLIAWGKEHPTLAQGLTVVSLGVGALMSAVGPLLITLPALKTGLELLGMMKAAGGAQALAGAFNAVKTGASAFGGQLAGLAASAGPFAIVIAAVIALGVELYFLKKKWDEAAKAGKQAGDNFKQAMAAEDAYAAKTGTEKQVAAQRQERESARVTASDRFWGAMTGGGRTGKDIARERVAMGQAIPKRAGGGPVSSGKPYLVGEQGPELFVPGSPGAIVAQNTPRSSASAPTSGGGQIIIELRLEPGLIASAAMGALTSRDGKSAILRVVRGENERRAPASAYGAYGYA